jgi:hypothetical protein
MRNPFKYFNSSPEVIRIALQNRTNLHRSPLTNVRFPA